MHGAQKIILTEGPTKRLLWILLFLGSWAMFLIQTEHIFENYFNYPRKTNVEIVSDYSLFPDVTFCPNRVVNFYDAQEWLANRTRSRNNETLKNIEEEKNVILSILRDVSLVYPIFHSVEFQSMFNQSAIPKEELFIYLVARLSNGTEIGYRDLDINEITVGRFLKCFTVSFSKYNNRVVSFDGRLLTGSGMIPDMSNETQYPWKPFVNNDGVAMYIHQPGVRIDPIQDFKFHELQPNKQYKILINVKQSVRLGPPHGKCSTSDPFVLGMQQGSNVPYRQQDCEASCMTKKILEKYGKVSMRHPPLDGMQCWLDENGTLATEGPDYVKRWCNYTALETNDGHPEKVGRMEASLWLLDGANASGCPCYPPCNGIDYNVFMNSKTNPFKADPAYTFYEFFEVRTFSFIVHHKYFEVVVLFSIALGWFPFNRSWRPVIPLLLLCLLKDLILIFDQNEIPGSQFNFSVDHHIDHKS